MLGPLFTAKQQTTAPLIAVFDDWIDGLFTFRALPIESATDSEGVSEIGNAHHKISSDPFVCACSFPSHVHGSRAGAIAITITAAANTPLHSRPHGAGAGHEP